LHATSRSQKGIPTIDIGISWVELWRIFIEVAFHLKEPQLKSTLKPKDVWNTIVFGILQLLEGKQFERGGFITSPFSKT